MLCNGEQAVILYNLRSSDPRYHHGVTPSLRSILLQHFEKAPFPSRAFSVRVGPPSEGDYYNACVCVCVFVCARPAPPKQPPQIGQAADR